MPRGIGSQILIISVLNHLIQVCYWIVLKQRINELNALIVSGNGLNQIQKIVVASVTVFVVTSILFFFVGFLCGHFCRKESTKITVQNPIYDDIQIKKHEHEVELKTNVAYASASQQ